MTRIRACFYPVLIGVVGCFWVAWRVAIPAVRDDEAYTLIASKRNIKALFRMFSHYDVVHGFYYVIMHYWLLLVPYTPFTLRLPSVISVGAAGTFVVLIARKFVPENLALLTGLIYFATPRTIWLATDARPNAPALLAVAAATYFFLKALDDGRFRWWLLYFGFALSSIYFVVYTAAVFAGYTLIAGFRWRRARRILAPDSPNDALRKLIIPAGGTALLYIASLPLFYQAARQQSFVGWRKLVDLEIVSQAPAEIFAHKMDPVTTTIWLILLAAVVTVLAVYWRRARTLPLNPLKLPLSIIAAWWLLPMGIAMAIGVFRSAYYPRYFSFATPVLALLFVLALAQLGWQQRKHLVVAVLTTIALAIPAAIQIHDLEIKDGGAVYYPSMKIIEHRRPSDGVWLSFRFPAWAYPETIKDAKDLNLTQSVNQTWRLNETTAPLRDLPDRIVNINRIVAALPYPNDQSDIDDLAYLHQVGFRIVSDEIVIRSRILVLERS